MIDRPSLFSFDCREVYTVSSGRNTRSSVNFDNFTIDGVRLERVAGTVRIAI